MERTLVQRSGYAPINQPHTQADNTLKGLRKKTAKLVHKSARMFVIGAILFGAAWCETAQGQTGLISSGTNNVSLNNFTGTGDLLTLGLPGRVRYGNLTNNGQINNNNALVVGPGLLPPTLGNLTNNGEIIGNGVNNPLEAAWGLVLGLPKVGVSVTGNIINNGTFNDNGNVSVIGVMNNSTDFKNNGSVLVMGTSVADLPGLLDGNFDLDKNVLINTGTFSGNGRNNAIQVGDLLDSPLLAGLGGLGDLGGDIDLAMLDTLGVEIKGGVGIVALGNIVNEGEFSGNGVVMAAGSIVNNGGNFIGNGKGDKPLNVGIDLGELVGLPIDIKPSIDINVLAMGNLENNGGQFIDNGNAIFMGAANNVGGTIGLQTIFLTMGKIDNSDDGKIVHNVVVATLDELDNSNGGLIEHNGVVASVGDMTNSGGTIHENALVATLGTLDNSDDGKITRNLAVAANSIDNTNGGLIDHNATVTTLAGNLDNKGGSITNNGLVSVLGGDMDNTNGTINHNATVTTLGGDLNNKGGSIDHNGLVTTEFGNLNNFNGGKMDGNLTVTVADGNLNNFNGGSITNNGLVTVADGNLNNFNGGSITDNEVVTVMAGNLNNSRGGTIARNEYVNVVAGDLNNRRGGTIADNNMVNVLLGDLNNSGSMYGIGSINVLEGSMYNTGWIDLDEGAELNVLGVNTPDLNFLGQNIPGIQIEAVNTGLITGNGKIETIYGFENNLGGTLSPGGNKGADIGTLTIERQLRNNGGTFAVDIDPLHYPGQPIAGVNNDLVRVVNDPQRANNGTAIINGGTVDVTAPSNIGAGSARYVGETQYTFLTTESGLTVDHKLVANTPSNVLLFDFVAEHDNFDYWLTVKRHYYYGGPCGLTFNQRAVGRYIDVIGRDPVPGSDFFNVLFKLDQLNENAGIAHRECISNDARFALDQMSGAIYGTIAKSSITNTTLANQTLNDVLRRNAFGCGCCSDGNGTASDPCCKDGAKGRLRHNLWGLAYGTGGSTQYDGNAYGYDQSFFGTLIGIDRHFGCANRVGFYTSYGEGRISSNLLEQSDSKELLVGLYLRRQMAVGYMLLSGGLGYNQYDTERTISFMNRKATNRHNAFVGTVYAERGLEIHRECVTWQPFVGLQYIGNQQESFTESGAKSLNLVGDITNDNSFRSMLGTRVSTNFAQVKRGKLSLSGQAYWMHEFAGAYSNFTAQFSNPNYVNFRSNAKYTVRGNDAGRDWAVLGTGLNYDRGNWRLFTGYDITMNSKQVLHTGNAGAAYGW